ncbi:hypothetical protein [Methanolobus sp. WCC4]|uniref:hypothetical protein n=1 Tax=Methanolobus sp. WCC4 TaxID=3125784 RepID=UPI0030FA9F32
MPLSTAIEIINDLKEHFKAIDNNFVKIIDEKETEMIRTGMHKTQIAYALADSSLQIVNAMTTDTTHRLLLEMGILDNVDMTDEETEIWGETVTKAEETFKKWEILHLKNDAEKLLFKTCKEWMHDNNKRLIKAGKSKDELELVNKLFDSIHEHPRHVKSLVSICMKVDMCEVEN